MDQPAAGKKKVSWGGDSVSKPNDTVSSTAPSSQRKSSILKKASGTDVAKGPSQTNNAASPDDSTDIQHRSSDHVVQRGGEFLNTAPRGDLDTNFIVHSSAGSSLLPPNGQLSQLSPEKHSENFRSTPLSPKVNTTPEVHFLPRSKWRADLMKSQRISLSTSEIVLQEYIPRDRPAKLKTNPKDPTKSFMVTEYPTLSRVDTSVGDSQCKAGTKKQWQTIISEARYNAPKVVSTEKPYLALIHKKKDTPTPDEQGYIKMPHSTQTATAYQVEKEEEQKLRAKTSLPSREELLSFNEREMFPKPRNSIPVSPKKNEPAQQGHQSVHRSPIKSSSPRRTIPRGAEFSYVDSSAMEEMFNDSELVKGQGYVPVNRYHPVEAPIVAGPWKLPEYACRDLQVDVVHFLTAEKPLDETKKRQLLWRGASEHRVSIVDTDDLSTVASFHLEKVKVIKYAMFDDHHHLLFTYSPDGSENKTVTMVMEIHAMKKDFAILKQCCYCAKVTIQQQCDSEKIPFFLTKRQEIMAIHNPPKPLPLPPRVVQTTPKKRRGRTPSQTKSTERLNSSSSPPNSPVESGKKTRTAPASSANTRAPRDQDVEISSDESESGIPNTLPRQLTPKIAKSTPTQAVTPGTKKHAVFYETNEEDQAPIRVSIGDLVVRTHKEGDEFVDHDGPWRILSFGKTFQATLINDDVNINMANGQVAKTRSHYDEDSWTKMLTTKVELNFPGTSRAKKLVPVSQLLPIIDMKNVVDGEIFASGSTVENMEEFVELRNRMNGARQDQHITFAGIPSTMDEDAGALCCFKVGPSKFLATIEVQPYLEDGEEDDSYEMQNLNAKRLRLFDENDPRVKGEGLVTEESDPWVQRLQKHHPEMLLNRVAVAEYHITWAGWPVEDRDWIIGQNNFQDETFVGYYNTTTDPYRDVPMDTQIDVAQLVYQEPKPKAPEKAVAKKKGAIQKVAAGTSKENDNESRQSPGVIKQRRTSAKHSRSKDNSDSGTPPPKRRRESDAKGKGKSSSRSNKAKLSGIEDVAKKALAAASNDEEEEFYEVYLEESEDDEEETET